MRHLVILAQSPQTGQSLALVRQAILAGTPSLRKQHGCLCPDPIIINPSDLIEIGVSEVFHIVLKQLNSLVGDATSALSGSGLSILVDTVNEEKLRIGASPTWESLVAMLILAYPEVHWVFADLRISESADLKWQPSSHTLWSLGGTERNYMLDPSGLRSNILNRTNQISSDGTKLPTRHRAAVAIDDELEYAVLHAYTAYRFGYRGEVISTWRGFENLLGVRDFEYSLSFEDMRLRFSDIQEELDISSLACRDALITSKHSPLPATTTFEDGRFLVTSGHGQGEKKILNDNRSYLKTGYPHRWSKYKVIDKPIGGMFDLWPKDEWTLLEKTLGFFRLLSRNPEERYVKPFHWPPCKLHGPTDQSGTPTHGSPGRLSDVATVLLERATLGYANALGPIDLIRCAVLASIAGEVLCGRNPTSYLSALTLRHQAEVSAELAFSGAGYHINVNDRLNEIENEALELSRWFSKEKRAKLNAQARILSQLAPLYREAGLFEEENTVLTRLRRVNRLLASSRAGWARMAHWPLAYAELLLSNVAVLLIVCVFNLVAMGVLFQLLFGLSYPDSMNAAVGSYFGGSNNVDAPAALTNEWKSIYATLGLISAALGAFHVGVAVTYLYSLTSRK